jgi:hypothetical protein
MYDFTIDAIKALGIEAIKWAAVIGVVEVRTGYAHPGAPLCAPY